MIPYQKIIIPENRLTYMEDYYVDIQEEKCGCCGTQFPAKRIFLNFDVLIRIFSFPVRQFMLLSKRISREIYPIIFHSLIPEYKNYDVKLYQLGSRTWTKLEQVVMLGNTTLFSYYYYSHPRDSDHVEYLNSIKGEKINLENWECLPCPIAKYQTLTQKILTFDEIFQVSTSLNEEVKKSCRNEAIKNLDKNSICRILMIARALNIETTQFSIVNYRAESECRKIRNLSAIIMSETEKYFK